MEQKNLRELWDVELDLLDRFKRICEKYGLSWFAGDGTLLGAARHRGFIPWDDDIDLYVPWEDYKKLLALAPGECRYPYFFQSFLNEKDGEASACRLRRSDTTGFTRWEEENVGAEYDRGIFIDVFPLFYLPAAEEEREIQKEAVRFFWKCMRGQTAFSQLERSGVCNPAYKPYLPYYESVRASMSAVDIKWAYLNACAYPCGRTGELGLTSYRVHQANQLWDAELFDSWTELPFENTTVRCPARYEAVLEKEYGDWRTPVKNASCHEMAAFDTKRPWREYLAAEK